MDIEGYFDRQYWVVDILPKQVPADAPGQYFRVEEYYLETGWLKDIRKKFLNILLKLNCYYCFFINSFPIAFNWNLFIILDCTCC